MASFATFLAFTLLAVAATQNVNSGSCSDVGDCDADNVVQVVSLLQSEMQMQVTRLMPVVQEHLVDEPSSEETPGAAKKGDESTELIQIAKQQQLKERSAMPAAKPAGKPTEAPHPLSRAELEHIKINASGDLLAFATAALVSTWGTFCCVIFFMVIKSYFPQVYEPNIAIYPELQSFIPAGRFGWARAAWAIDTQTVMQTAGLDAAMHLQFVNMALKILLTMGMPMMFIMGPVNAFLGGFNAGGDRLSYLSFGNIVNGSPLYWIHALVIWAVCLITQWHIHAGQKSFLKYRFQWLRELPEIRAHTVLVEGIPADYQSDARLMDFFKAMFGSPAVVSSYVVKKAPELEKACNKKDRIKKALLKARFRNTKANASPEDNELERTLVTDLQQQQAGIKTMRKEVKTASENTIGPDGYNTSSGFVTFASRSEATSALTVQYSEDCDEWEVSIPPEPSSILWKDLQQDPNQAYGLTVLGYVLIAGLFVLYMPIVIFVTQIAVNINMGPLQPLWQALAPSLGLMFMVSYLPTFLHLIFQACFTLKETAWSQYFLQKFLFVFQLVFVVLVTSIGGSVMEFGKTLAQSPLEIFGLLGSTMPHATHFYMNYVTMCWMTHCTQLTRSVILGKYLFFGRVFDDETALELAEPEDQDYYGLGARSTRMTINLMIGIIFGTLCPPMLFVTFIDFLVSRTVYGYLLPFAETRKPDLGGAFWVQTLRQLFVGNIIYCLMMTGVLIGRASTNGPALIAAPCLLYVIWSMKKFERAYMWEQLPFKELVDANSEFPSKEDQGEYIQPMLSGINPSLRAGLRKPEIFIDAFDDRTGGRIAKRML